MHRCRRCQLVAADTVVSGPAQAGPGQRNLLVQLAVTTAPPHGCIGDVGNFQIFPTPGRSVGGHCGACGHRVMAAAAAPASPHRQRAAHQPALAAATACAAAAENHACSQPGGTFPPNSTIAGAAITVATAAHRRRAGDGQPVTAALGPSHTRRWPSRRCAERGDVRPTAFPPAQQRPGVSPRAALLPPATADEPAPDDPGGGQFLGLLAARLRNRPLQPQPKRGELFPECGERGRPCSPAQRLAAGKCALPALRLAGFCTSAQGDVLHTP